MIAARKSILLGLAALSLLAGLSGCVVAERRPGHYRGDYVAQGPSGHPHHWNNGNQGGWSNNGWQGNQGGGWNN